jgi:gamma-glutamylcyclotransferase (GGCT)/AIG2-like uncharacterized protein YtfP
MPNTERLFVYGTLAPGRSNHHLLEDCPGSWQRPRLQGHLLDEEWGAQFGFPGIVPSNEADYVEGYVLTSDGLRERWAMLDAFEGKEYQRAPVQVYLANEESVAAFVYVIAEPYR